jgi:hypothetical protein
MKLNLKSITKIIVSASDEEINQKGFEKVWDMIRQKYPENLFDVHIIEHDNDKSCIFFELSSKENP